MTMPAGAWEHRLKMLCNATTPGCEVWLTKGNAKTLGAELHELSSQKGEEIPPANDLQEQFCMQFTTACPDGTKGTVRHVFAPAGTRIGGVSVRIKSTLQKGKVRVFWKDPLSPNAPKPSGTIDPGSSITQSSWPTHVFQLLAPGVGHSDAHAVVTLTVSEDENQHYEFSKNSSYRYRMPDKEANPAVHWNKKYFIKQVDSPEPFRAGDDL